MTDFEREKAIACFVRLARKESDFTLPSFKNTWKKIWGLKNVCIEQVFKEVYPIVKSMSKDEISSYRESFRKAVVSDELKEKASNFGLSVSTGKYNMELSGYRINVIPESSGCVIAGEHSDMTYDDVCSFFENLPELSSIKEMESYVISKIDTVKTNDSIFIKLLKNYYAPYFTFNFARKVNRALMRKDIPIEVKKALVEMGNRLGIVDLSNHNLLRLKKCK